MNMMSNMIHDDDLLSASVCSDELSIASCSSFDGLVNKVLDGAASTPPSSITTFKKGGMDASVLPRQVTNLNLEDILLMNRTAKRNEIPFAALKRLPERKKDARPIKKQRTEAEYLANFLAKHESDIFAASNQRENKQKNPKQDLRRWKSRPRPPVQEADIKESTPRLHVSSCLSFVTAGEIQDLLLVDPKAIRRPVAMPDEPYKYPLNLAIHNNATADVIRMLLEADPTVTSLPDGVENQGSLHILLHQQRNRSDILPLVDSFLLAHPICAQIQDKNGCVPLHLAVYHQAELDTVRHLIMVYPEALQVQNRRQQTPVTMATQLHSICSDAIATYLSESLLEMENEIGEMGDAPGIPVR
jgi:hypothetical protein